MQTVRLGQKFFFCGTFSDAVEGREAGSRAKRNGNAGLVWRHSSDHRDEATTVLREF